MVVVRVKVRVGSGEVILGRGRVRVPARVGGSLGSMPRAETGTFHPESIASPAVGCLVMVVRGCLTMHCR